MKKYILLSLAALMLVPLSGEARRRSKSEIMGSAARVLIRNGGGEGRRLSPSRGTSLKVLDENTAFTVVGYSEGSYAVVANDDMLPDVLGYSTTPYDTELENPAFRWWCRSIADVTERIVSEGAAPARVKPNPTQHAAEVPQLLTDKWGQMEPFNNLCPLEYDASGRLVGRTVVGCVALSASQVMRYHQYPAQGRGIHVDMQTEDANGRPIPIKVDFSDYKFDYSLMKDTYGMGTYTEEEADAVARLCYPVGVSFGMIYGTDASGTYADSAAYALKKYLKFDDVKYYERSGQNETTWMNMIFSELTAHRPVLYSGADDFLLPGGGGHAFVFDGYDADGLVHVNWGWYGRNDGYYEVSLLNPRFHSFKNQQEMIIGVAPPRAQGARTLALTGSITLADLQGATALSKEGEYDVLDLSGATLPEGRLPERAFYSSYFRRIILPETTVAIGDGAFANCRYLEAVTFPAPKEGQEFVVEDDIIYTPDFKEVIEVMPYYHNDALVITDYNSLLTMRDGVTTLHPYAADGCFRIAGVMLPATVKSIGSHAFSHCTNLKVVVATSPTPPSAGKWAFSTLDPAYTRLYVPAGFADTYLRIGEWDSFYAFDNVFDYGTTVRARNAVRNVGEENPELTYQVMGDYVTGEPTLTCDADIDSPAGEYVIKVEIGSLSGDNILLCDGTLRVLGSGESGVEAVESGAPTAPYDVYTIDGRNVARGAATLDAFPAGLYIINGIKTIIE